MTEKEKAAAGMLYNANYDKELIGDRIASQKKCKAYNAIDNEDLEKRREEIKNIVAQIGEGGYIEQPFYCDYGYNIKIGKNFYSNYNLVILDCASVTIGDNVFIGPDCGIYTAGHPINAQQRNEGLEYAYGITIGNNVWIGGGVRIMPGVTIGDNCVIGAGSVVTKNVPPGVIAVGNPCRVLREIDERDIITQK